MSLELFIQTVVNATYAASYMALIAVGLVLIFGVMGVINFAHGELYMAGAYAVVALYAGIGLPFFLAVFIGLIFVGLLGLLMEYTMFRPLRDNPLGGLDRLDRLSADLADHRGARVRRAHGARAAVNSRQDRALRRRRAYL